MSTTGIGLTATTHALEMITSSAQSVDYTVSATDVVSGVGTEVSNQGNVASATTTTILAAPGASTQRLIHSITVVNKGASTNAITIQKDVSGTNHIVFGPVTIDVGEQIEFTQDRGFIVKDAFGRERRQSGPTTIAVTAGASSNLVTSLAFTNGGGVSFTLSTAGNAATLGASVAAAPAQSINISGGASSVLATAMTFTNLNNVGFAMSTNASGAIIRAAASVSVIAGGSTNLVSVIQFSNQNGVTFGLDNQTVTASVAAGAAVPQLRHWNNFSPEPITTITHTANSMWLFPLPTDRPFDGAMTVETMRLGVVGSVSITSAFSSTFRVALYTMVNSTQLSLLNSVSATFNVSANANNTQVVNGNRFVTFSSAQWSTQPTLSQTHYWMGVIVNTGNHSGSGGFQGALVGRSQQSGLFGVSSSATQKYYPFFGMLNTSAFPASIGASAVSNNNNYGQAVPAVQFLNGVATV